jgi:hypothetical protein
MVPYETWALLVRKMIVALIYPSLNISSRKVLLAMDKNDKASSCLKLHLPKLGLMANFLLSLMTSIRFLLLFDLRDLEKKQVG